MFGWEFPPHISGGLGTACEGLSSALLQEGIRLLFVVPNARGNESIPLINASTVTLPGNIEGSKTDPSSLTQLTVVPIPSSLTAYGFYEPATSIECWNWSFRDYSKDNIHDGHPRPRQFTFSGGYGKNLIPEVFRYARVASVLARQYAPNIIHAHDWMTYPAGIEAKRITGKPLFIHVHATEVDRSGPANVNRQVWEIEREGMQQADCIIAVSEWTRNIIIEHYDIPADKIQVVHNGITSVETHQPLPVSSITKSFVTFLGRVTYQKGPLYFIAAAQKVLERFPGTHFIVAGSGDMLPAMLEEVANARLSSRIHFSGFLSREQIAKVWALTDVYVMPSVSEPFGITPLEAIQAGVPVIISNQSGVAEVLEHAIKVDFWDTDAIAEAIITVLEQPSLAQVLRENSRKEIKSLSWSRAAKKINELYHAYC